VLRRLNCRLRQERCRDIARHGVISAGALTPESLVRLNWILRRLHFPATLSTAPDVPRVAYLITRASGGASPSRHCHLAEDVDLEIGTSNTEERIQSVALIERGAVAMRSLENACYTSLDQAVAICGLPLGLD